MAFGYTKYMGLITVTAGVNDKIGWVEFDNIHGPYGLSETIPAGDYWLDDDSGSDLFATMIALMDAKSDALGLGQDYAGVGVNYSLSANNETGIVTASGAHAPSGANFSWYPFNDTVSTDQIWTGGATGAGDLGKHDPNHIGYNVVTNAARWGTSFVSDVSHANSWYPDQPIQEGTKPRNRSIVVESETGGGDVRTYDFTGNPLDSDDNSYLDRWTPRYTRLADEHRTWWFSEFWRPYAKQGLPDGRFRFYSDRESASYDVAGLSGDILREAEFTRTIKGYPLWTIAFDLKRYKP